ncbi:hypothetical protein [Variovorax sp. RA8]|uniref:hypothetical protein n=1 Tax=Variovorax sp. (strain JCM 16519 / RA8) TaxID=662548 RepID=UPI000A4F5ECC|nr:hypothetical protein [Variovorax sp. RA8]VTU36495.1 hypothetical protein RA8CHR_05489 [Variovorax sp. RA8]
MNELDHPNDVCEVSMDFLTPNALAPSSIEDAPFRRMQPPRRKFDPALRGVASRARQDIQRHVDAYIQQEVARHPELGGLAIRGRVSATPKASSGSSAVLKEIIDRILSPSVATATRTSIREGVQKKFPQQAVYKDWSKPLPEWAMRFVRQRAACGTSAVARMKVGPSMTLSQLYIEARTSLAREQGAQSYRATITVSAHHITINGQEFKVTQNKSNGKTYDFVRLSMDKLNEAMRASLR